MTRFRCGAAFAAFFFCISTSLASAQSPHDGDDCIYWWNETINDYNDSLDDHNRGWDIVGNSPNRAFDLFNRASSSISSFPNFGACTLSTSLTNRQIDDLDDARRGLIKSSECGMKTSSLTEAVIDLEDAVDRYNAGNLRPQDLAADAGYAVETAEDVIYAWACEDDGNTIGYARDMEDWAEDVRQFAYDQY